MRQHRFFIGQDLGSKLSEKNDSPVVFEFDPEVGDSAAIINHQREILRQWKKVFRYEAGSEVILFDGKVEVVAKILELSKKDEKARLVLGERKTPVYNSGSSSGSELNPNLNKSKIYLALSILKGEHTDMVVEKATELGVSGIILVQTDRVIKKGEFGKVTKNRD